ncbi:MAG: site-specific DNA-methyltransferase [Chloroflexota bacterium]|nr:site-specific DNA-methyltransferase [Chloroflexota bacterium]
MDDPAAAVPSVWDDQMRQLRDLFPTAFHGDTLDVPALVAALGGMGEGPARERYAFTFAGQQQARLTLQQPPEGILVPVAEQSVLPDSLGNFVIEGDNLEVLKLLYQAYARRVKLIYIDPPYNTGNDFVYPDNFAEPMAQYQRLTGQRAADNTLTTSESDRPVNGHRHSNWMRMLYPRLFLARQLLRDDGVIFVSIDDNEVHNLRLLLNEVFGEENFVTTIAWQKKYSPQNDATYFSTMHDYIVVYARQIKANKSSKVGWDLTLPPRTEGQNARYTNPDNDERGVWKPSDLSAKTYSAEYDYPITTPTGRIVNPPRGRSWSMPQVNFDALVADNRIWFGESGNNVPSVKLFLSDVQQGIVPKTWWTRDVYGDNQEAKQEMNALLEGLDVVFDTPKPVRLLKSIVRLGTSISDGDIVLDFFAGSGTTAQAVLELNREDGGNRRFILVQLPEPTGKSDYPTIAAITQERVRRAIDKIQREAAGRLPLDGGADGGGPALGFTAFKLVPSPFKRWRNVTDPAQYARQLALHVDTLHPDHRDLDLLWALAWREGYGLRTQIEPLPGGVAQQLYRVHDPDKDQAFVACLDEPVPADVLRAGLPAGVGLFVCLDRALDDTLAANLKLQCHDMNCRLKTV